MSETPPGSGMEKTVDKMGVKLAKNIFDSIKNTLKNTLLGNTDKRN